ncbi:alpha/beta fold hydrolase [Beijerinckia sp. L45]|uniref:alpha/beta fold hydrolase n=1 Tax=Beijerinckia sp. L45 TaxID=1641855 RepID=UPI00131DB600|nr:alpha/beta hydrolase [Beijerinckia sp. L45]
MASAGGESRYYAAADCLRLHLRDYDPGAVPATPLVCLAGLTRSADDFDPLAQNLAFKAAVPRRVIAFDYRGRGLSDHDPDWRHYDLATERADILAGLALCGIDQAHVLGTSRGGLHIMAMAAPHRALFRSVILNDIGPVLEPDGLARIKTYVGRQVHPRDLREAIQLLKIGAGLHFTALSPEEWHLFATTTFGTDEAHLGLRYDPALAHLLDSFDLTKPLPALWDQFDALRGLPVLTIRGENSDLLSVATTAAMAARWDGCETHLVPGQGHAPLLADEASMTRIEAFLAAND